MLPLAAVPAAVVHVTPLVWGATGQHLGYQPIGVGGLRVTVQVVKTGITPPLATSGRFWGAEMERLHHARRLHAQQRGTPSHGAAVASTSPPPSSCLRQS